VVNKPKFLFFNQYIDREIGRGWLDVFTYS